MRKTDKQSGDQNSWRVSDVAFSDPACRIYITMARWSHDRLDPKTVSARIHYQLKYMQEDTSERC
uniref:HipA, putative n=1 Tax=Bifidobacterium breve TaxID=1685 RepID=A0A0A0UV17_BIFBR|nr:HipA, putative [Bifidobacterium breve]